MFLSAFLSVIGLGFLCWLLFSLAVYALPFFVAVTVGYYAFDHGAGPMGAVVVALFAGAIALVLGQVAFGIIRSQIIRLALGALYALPSGVAGFHAVKGFSQVGGAGEAWTLLFASIGAVIVGVTAWVRIASLAGPEIRSGARAIHHAGRAVRDG